jgi:hypothetical protein
LIRAVTSLLVLQSVRWSPDFGQVDKLDLAIDSTGLHVAAPDARGGISCTSRSIPTAAASWPRTPTSDVHHTVPTVLGHITRVYGDGAYASGPTYRAVAQRRQVLPNAEGIFRPKAPDVRVTATLAPSR